MEVWHLILAIIYVLLMIHTIKSWIITLSKRRAGGKTAYDSNGIITRLDFNYDYELVIPKDMTFEFVFSALQDGAWNPDFKRELHIPTTELMLEITIGQFK